jgi:hypothetical protein
MPIILPDTAAVSRARGECRSPHAAGARLYMRAATDRLRRARVLRKRGGARAAAPGWRGGAAARL